MFGPDFRELLDNMFGPDFRELLDNVSEADKPHVDKFLRWVIAQRTGHYALDISHDAGRDAIVQLILGALDETAQREVGWSSHTTVQQWLSTRAFVESAYKGKQVPKHLPWRLHGLSWSNKDMDKFWIGVTLALVGVWFAARHLKRQNSEDGPPTDAPPSTPDPRNAPPARAASTNESTINPPDQGVSPEILRMQHSQGGHKRTFSPRAAEPALMQPILLVAVGSAGQAPPKGSSDSAQIHAFARSMMRWRLMSVDEWEQVRDSDTAALVEDVDGRQLVAVAMEVRAEGFAEATERLTTLRAALRTAAVTVRDVRQVNGLSGGLSSTGWRTS